METNDDCEKQLKVAEQKQDQSDQFKSESEPLITSNIHLHETKSSSPRLPQQCDYKNVIKESQGNVKDICKKFENTGTSPGKGNDTGGKATSSPPSSSFPKPAPGPGQMDSGGEMDLQHKELNNVPTTEEDGDTDSKHSNEEFFEDASENPEELQRAVQMDAGKQQNEHHKDHDEHIQNNFSKEDWQPTNEEQIELNTVTNSDHVQ
ncbi:uncharacterized protein LOC110168532 [Boleophthalmus pectinirostris]|uniref:uncharacterized protein LOC110168532 n=1 Tax=Boleophthalmus pectinirostris TaxID=150288 RepID=UPI002431E0FA|nr:uncharacterized protein LOC110168532 [Boleophthalmus pectinirostris]